MFGPNVVPSYSHRDRDFGWLVQSTVELFQERFDLANATILLISGSGTLANEIVLWSARRPFRLVTDGLFSRRLIDTQRVHQTVDPDNTRTMGVQYETSRGHLNRVTGLDFVDAISAFPYYPAPDSAVWTTVSSKQIGASTGLSVIVLRDRRVLEDFRDEEHSYLSLTKYANKALTHYTPNTPSMDAIASLHNTLLGFDLNRHCDTINQRRHLLETVFAEHDIPTHGEGPVITVPRHSLPEELVKRWNLYTNSGDIQLFLWTGLDSQYTHFIKEIKSCAF